MAALWGGRVGLSGEMLGIEAPPIRIISLAALAALAVRTGVPAALAARVR